MKSIDEMIKLLENRLKAMPGVYDEKIGEVIEFIESLREEVVFCKKCEKLRLDPGVEMTINATTKDGEKKEEKLEMCGPCLEEFLGKMAPHAEEVEYELDDGTKLTTEPGSKVMTIHDPALGEGEIDEE